jgi:hypothetical protein
MCQTHGVPNIQHPSPETVMGNPKSLVKTCMTRTMGAQRIVIARVDRRFG